MPTPQAGITHDLVIHWNNSKLLGLIAKPGTFRVGNAPTFIPRLAVGDPRGLDYSNWRSFVQESFDGGAGQYRWGGAYGNNRFAESSFLEIGLPTSSVGQIVGRNDEILGLEIRGREAFGSLRVDVLPQATTSFVPIGMLFTNQHPVFVLKYSNRPHLAHNVYLGQYHSTKQTDFVWQAPLQSQPGLLEYYQGNPTAGIPLFTAVGNWLSISHSLAPVSAAVGHSDCIVLTSRHTNLQLYGSTNGIAPAYLYYPLYTTRADMLGNHDGRLWRSFENRLAYLQPTGTTDAWSTYFQIGDKQSKVVNMVTFAGKLRLGKEDSLWAYDAGRVYEVANFGQEWDTNNFRLMVVHRGALYFNIRQRIYRLTASESVEVLDTPNFDGFVTDGTSLGDDLYIMLREPDGTGRCMVYNPERGGAREWFHTPAIALNEGGIAPGPSGIKAATGMLWIAPVALTGEAIRSSSTPIATVNKLASPAQQVKPNYYDIGRNAYMVTSMLNFGYPGVDKLFNRVLVTHNMYAATDKIDVYYLTQLGVVSLLGAFRYTGANADGPIGALLDDGTAAVTDGLAGPSDPVWNWETVSNDTMFLGFAAPIAGINLVVRNDYGDVELAGGDPGASANVGFVNGPIYYFNGIIWNANLVQNTNGTSGDITNSTTKNYGGNTVWAHHDGRLTWVAPADWKPSVVNGVTAYWLAFDNISGLANFGPRIVEINGLGPIHKTLKDQPWIYLGSVKGNDSPAKNIKELAFPTIDGQLPSGRELILKFEFIGSDVTAPELTRYEVEWQPIGPKRDLVKVGFVALGIDGLETLQPGIVEDSAQYIHATLWSLNAAGRPYTVQLPYPPPIGHTRRMQVIITDPGAAIPVLGFGHTSLQGEIPLVLEEL